MNHKSLQPIIGESSSLAETLEHTSLLAPLNKPILIVGERGTGKELIADRLHFLSPRWEHSQQKVNCAAISEQLLDTELFGNDKGAFTGATSTNLGRFERSDKGTLFLDEIGLMPIRIQEKLLRLIEYGEFERVGGQETLSVDVRIIAATNEDLPALADSGKFRKDLLDRLVFDVIRTPPLRHRKDDIAELSQHFALKMAHELNWEYHSGFSQEAMDTLLNHHWPGNIRELKNTIERSLCRWGQKDRPIETIILNPFAAPDEQSKPAELVHTSPSDALPTHTQETRKHTAIKAHNFEQQTKNFEVQLLKSALRQSRYKQKEAAETLKLTYHQLRALLKKYKDELNENT